MDQANLEQIKQYLVDELMDGSKKKSSSNRRSQSHLNHDRGVGHESLFNDYFTDELVYPDNVFHQRF